MKALKPCLLLLSTLAAKMSLAYVILDLVFSEYAMKGIFQYSVKRTLVVLKIDDDNETKNVQVRAQRPNTRVHIWKKFLAQSEDYPRMKAYIRYGSQENHKFSKLGPGE